MEDRTNGSGAAKGMASRSRAHRPDRGLGNALAHRRASGTFAACRARRPDRRRGAGRDHRSRDPIAAHVAGAPHRRDARPLRRRIAGPAAQSLGRARAVRSAAGSGRGRVVHDRILLCRRHLACGAARRHRRRARLDRRPGRHCGPPCEPHRDAAGRACIRKLRRRHDRADPQSRAQSLRRARDRVLAARLAGGPQHRSPRHCGAVLCS